MNTKAQTKAIKAEISALKKALRAEESTTVKQAKKLDREILATNRQRDRLVTQCDLRTSKIQKRIAILEGRL